MNAGDALAANPYDCPEKYEDLDPWSSFESVLRHLSLND